MLYLIVIGFTMFITTALAIITSVVFNTVSLWHALIPMAVNIYVLLLLGVVSLLMRLIIPTNFWIKKRKCFKVWRKEKTFYDRIKIKKWKDKIPEMGKIAGFPKDSIRSMDCSYLQKFIAETCFAEWMHFIVGVVGFTALCFCPIHDYVFVVPILIVNFILHLLPCMIQRYNRLRLTEVVNRLSCKNRTEVASDFSIDSNKSAA